MSTMSSVPSKMNTAKTGGFIGHPGNDGGSVQISSRLILGVAVTVTWAVAAFLMYSLLSSKGIAGWDTPAYLYYTAVLGKEGLGEFLSKTSFGSQGMLYYFILLLGRAISGFSLLSVDRLAASLLFGGVLALPAVMVFKWTGKVGPGLLCLSFSLLWAGPYILASNLHSNLTGFFVAIIALIIIPGAVISGGRSLPLALALLLLASFSHPQTALFVGLVVFVTTLPAALDRRTRLVAIRAGILLVVSVVGFAFSLFMMGGPTVAGPLLNPDQAAATLAGSVDVTTAFSLLGHNLLPLVAVSFATLADVAFRRRDKVFFVRETFGQALVVAWATSSLLMWVLSYAFPLLVTYADRVLVLFPVPIIASLGLSHLLGRLGVW